MFTPPSCQPEPLQVLTPDFVSKKILSIAEEAEAYGHRVNLRTAAKGYGGCRLSSSFTGRMHGEIKPHTVSPGIYKSYKNIAGRRGSSPQHSLLVLHDPPPPWR